MLQSKQYQQDFFSKLRAELREPGGKSQKRRRWRLRRKLLALDREYQQILADERRQSEEQSEQEDS